MIYLITGVPGSGKTLYAVSTLVQSLAAQKLKRRGQDITRRVVVDGIPDLVIPHDRMAEVVEDDKGQLSSDGDSVLNWFSWCMPGDILVIDEVQRHWRPRGMATKPPDMIKALETHRHMGVDFVLITQNPMLIDQNVRRLVGRHQHIRRLFGMQRAVIYDWDGCSVDVHRTKSATMSMWAYPRSAYRLYKSSELHVKQKQKIPPWLAVPVLALIGGLAVAPTAFSTMKGAMTGQGIAPVSSAAPAGDAAAPVSQVSASSRESDADPQGDLPAEESPKSSPAVIISGCAYTVELGCRCYTAEGYRIPAPSPHLCEDLASKRPPAIPGMLTEVPPYDRVAALSN